MLKVGMKALVIGARTPIGQQYIGCEVTLESHFENGEVVSENVVQPFRVRFLSGNSGWVVSREGLQSHLTSFKPGYALFATHHLMPIPPLADPGIDECTFTPIIQKENA